MNSLYYQPKEPWDQPQGTQNKHFFNNFSAIVLKHVLTKYLDQKNELLMRDSFYRILVLTNPHGCRTSIKKLQPFVTEEEDNIFSQTVARIIENSSHSCFRFFYRAKRLARNELSPSEDSEVSQTEKTEISHSHMTENCLYFDSLVNVFSNKLLKNQQEQDWDISEINNKRLRVRTEEREKTQFVSLRLFQEESFSPNDRLYEIGKKVSLTLMASVLKNHIRINHFSVLVHRLKDLQTEKLFKKVSLAFESSCSEDSSEIKMADQIEQFSAQREGENLLSTKLQEKSHFDSISELSEMTNESSQDILLQSVSLARQNLSHIRENLTQADALKQLYEEFLQLHEPELRDMESANYLLKKGLDSKNLHHRNTSIKQQEFEQNGTSGSSFSNEMGSNISTRNID